MGSWEAEKLRGAMAVSSLSLSLFLLSFCLFNYSLPLSMQKRAAFKSRLTSPNTAPLLSIVLFLLY